MDDDKPVNANAASKPATCDELAPVVYGWTRGRDPALDKAWWLNHEPGNGDLRDDVPVFR